MEKMTQGTLETENNKLEALTMKDLARAKEALEKANVGGPYYMLKGKFNARTK